MTSPLKAVSRVERLAAHSEPVARARFVDGARSAALERLGVRTIRDLLGHVPFRYVDLTNVTSLADVKVGQDATVVGRVHEVVEKRPRPRLTVTEVALVDGTGVLLGVWFNQPWVKQRFLPGERVAFAGRVELSFGLKRINAPFVERLSAEDAPEAHGCVLPVHRTSDGLSTGWLRRIVAAAVDDFADVCDHVPWEIRRTHDLVPLGCAYRDIHFPSRVEAAERARERLAYDELLLLQLYMAMRRYSVTRERTGIAHTIDGSSLSALAAAIPFNPTQDQARAIDEVLADMSLRRPMNRLLLGDVGTGKTLVAAHALAAVADTGSQAAMMAPTEVLATQYATKVGPLLDSAGIRWALLTGSTPRPERVSILSRITAGEMDVVFGTHALLEADVAFKHLTLAIVDEQHRFGVNQRLALRGKGVLADLLVMTATPIPRSLALTLYGDLATSYLKTRPNTAAPTVTRHVKPHQAAPAHEAVRRAVREGRQAYVVCALVDESDRAQAKAATREAERLATQVFPDLRVGLLTGRMRPAEKASTMRAFVTGELDVLVSTTVIEVGVDVPNATVMIVEDADRFGLAQLHQLRGRVGRGEHPGEVWLVADPKSNDSKERISSILSTTDGFELAERDLRLRGEGQLLGGRQHGLPDLRVASLVDDLSLVEAARRDAFRLIDRDPHLSSPEHVPLRAAVEETFRDVWEWVSSG